MRYVCGSVLITIADNVVMSVGTSLFTKVISPAFQGLWIGILIAAGWLAQLLSVIWVGYASTQQTLNDDAPYELTLALIGVSLLLMIPIYRYLLPRLYSPWSGSALPTKQTPLISDEGPRFDAAPPAVTTPLLVTSPDGDSAVHVMAALKQVEPLTSKNYAQLD